jgi:hypothetical protein
MLPPKVMRCGMPYQSFNGSLTSALKCPVLTMVNAGLQKFCEKSGSTQVLRFQAESLSDEA